MEQEAREIRREVATLGARGRGFRYPTALKERIADYVRARRAQGATQQVVADELEIPWVTLSRWSLPRRPQPQVRGLVPVHLSAVPVRSNAGAELALVCPGGFRLEGLSLETAVELLRRLSR
jgi:transposase